MVKPKVNMRVATNMMASYLRQEKGNFKCSVSAYHIIYCIIHTTSMRGIYDLYLETSCSQTYTGCIQVSHSTVCHTVPDNHEI